MTTLEPSRCTVPARLAGYTPAWMNTVLRKHHPGVCVRAVQADDVDVGTTTRIRLRITYDHGSGPDTVVVKAQGPLRRRVLLASMGILYPEARFYAASSAIAIETPLVYAVGIDRSSLRTVIVMEDLLSRGGVPNYPVSPLDPAEVENALGSLARMHGRFWRADERPGTAANLDRLPDDRSLMARFAVPVTAGAVVGVRRLKALDRNLVPARLMSPAKLGSWLIRSQVRAPTRRPRTVLHGDPHIGNTYRLGDGSIGFYDWQVAQWGSWEHDVGYFMISALDIADRRKHERALLDSYLSVLRGCEVDSPTDDEAWTAYRRTPAYGLPGWISTLMGNYQRPENTLAAIERFAAAFEDLDTIELVTRRPSGVG